jgi:hypothetical protein
MTTFAIGDLSKVERDYDSWLATLTQASARLDVLQTAVDELRELCRHEHVVPCRRVITVLERHGAVT